MSNIYLKHCDDYFQAGMLVTPVRGKAAFIQNWANSDLSEVKDGRMKNCNIGLLTGKKSGVTVLDIDIIDQSMVDKILEKLPPILCGKKGKKGINIFFAYNGEASTSYGKIDILSDGRQTVLPPSIHPDTNTPYEWIGKPLLEIDIDDLPILTNEMVSDITKITGYQESGFDGEGRHNTLFRICCGKISDNVPINDIKAELIEYDELNHMPPYFTDETETHKGKNAAERMIRSAIKLHEKSGGTYAPVKLPEIKIEEISFVKEVKQRKHFPHLRGIMQEMFKYIYDNSPVPRSRFALAASLTATSTIIGNKVRLGSVHPNLYALMLAPSGSGKDFPLKFPKRLFAASGHRELIGQSHPVSDTGIIKTLPNQPVRLDSIDEADILFNAINSTTNAYASKMADVYATLYTSCGDYFEGKHLASHDKVVGACQSPYVNMLAAMTPNAFRESFTVKTMEKGLGGRFLYFIDEQKKRSKPMIEHKDIPYGVKEFVKMWRNLKTDTGFKMDSGQLIEHIPSAELTKSAKKELISAHSFIEDILEKMDGDDKLAPVVNRAYVLIQKLALTDAVSLDYKNTDITIKKESVEWAMAFWGTLLDEMKDFIEINVSGSQNERLSNYVLEKIEKYGTSGITRTKLVQKTRAITKVQRNMFISELIEMSAIYEVKNEGTTYYYPASGVTVGSAK